jgi:hypothetical protein
MRLSASRRWSAAVLSLAAALLACARAELPIVPAQPERATPIVAAGSQGGYPGPESGAAATPPATAQGSGYPGPAGDTPAPAAASHTPAPPTATLVIQLPPTDTPPPSETPAPTDTSAPTPTPAASNTPIRVATATSAGPASSPTAPPATAAPTTGAATAPQPIVAGAALSQDFEVANEGGLVVGRPQDLRDGREDTWASLRGGNASWLLELNSPQTVVGVRLLPRPDFNDPVTLTRIEISPDGSVWTTVYLAPGNCGVPNCDTLTPQAYAEFGFPGGPAVKVRLTSGPTRFAFSEVQLAVAP